MRCWPVVVLRLHKSDSSGGYLSASWVQPWFSKAESWTSAAAQFLFSRSLLFAWSRVGVPTLFCASLQPHFWQATRRRQPLPFMRLSAGTSQGLFLCTPPVFCSKITQRPDLRVRGLRYPAIQSSQWKKPQKDLFLLLSSCALFFLLFQGILIGGCTSTELAA